MFRRPSAALVVAAVAIFLSTTGTALAAIIISDNSQVAAHTIAGAQAPSGDNQNIIPGTIGTKDLADASVASTKLGDDARTHKIQFLAFAFSAKVLAQVGHMTFGATCEPNVPSAGQVTLLLNVGNSDPHAFADISWSYLPQRWYWHCRRRAIRQRRGPRSQRVGQPAEPGLVSGTARFSALRRPNRI